MSPRPWLLAALLAVGCGPGGADLGLAGCAEGPAAPFSRSELNTIEQGAHVALTAAGADVLIDERERLAGLLLDVDPDGWVRLDIPPQETGSDRLGIGLRNLRVAFDLRAALIGLAFVGEPARIRLTLDDARLRFESGEVWVGVGGNGACTLENGVFRGDPGEHFLTASIAVDIFPEVDVEGRFVARVAVMAPTIERLDIELGVDPNLPECSDFGSALECELACGASDLGADILELLYGLFDEQLNALLTPFVEAAVNDLLAQYTDKPLAIEGAVGGGLLAALLPLPSDAHALQYLAAPTPEGFSLRTAGDRGDGLGLTLDVGLDAVDHPCVPPTNRAPQLAAGPPPALTGYDAQGDPYHLGLAVAGAVLDRLLWSVWRSGELCLRLDSDALEGLAGQRIDTDTLGLLLPGLDRLADGPRPLMIVLDPQVPVEAFPLVGLRAIDDDGGVPQVGLSLDVPRLGVEIHAYLEGRWSRVFAARADIGLDVVVQAMPDSKLALALDAPRIGPLEIEYDAPVATDDVPTLLRLVLDLATRALSTEALAFDVDLGGLVEELLGLPYRARIAGLRLDGPMRDHVSVLFALDRIGGAALRGPIDTAATVEAVTPGRAVLRVEAPGAVAARFQHRVDGGPWRPLRAAVDGRLAVEEPLLRLPGAHRIELRAVAEGAYGSLDPSPAALVVEVPASVEPAAPSAGAPAPVDGCRAAPGEDVPGAAALLLLIALGRARRRR